MWKVTLLCASLAILAFVLFSAQSTLGDTATEGNADITILNPVEILKPTALWTVMFNVSGTADLHIDSPNAMWNEIPGNHITVDEMEFMDIRCGTHSVKERVQVSDGESMTPQGSFEGKPVQFIIEDYACNETSYLVNYMNISGYATLRFSFGSSIAYAYDPDSCDYTVGNWGITASDNCIVSINTTLNTNSQTFVYTGAQQTFNVPAGVTAVTIEAVGAAGANGSSNKNSDTTRDGGLGGNGSRTITTIPVTPSETLYIYVGGSGRNGTSSTGGAGGYNGGAAGDAIDYGGGGGGGSTDVRQGGNAVGDRVVVAGGGGGGGGASLFLTWPGNTGANGGAGGAGGHTTGTTGSNGGNSASSAGTAGGGGAGGGGTQSAGGSAGAAGNGNGAFGDDGDPGNAGVLQTGGAGGDMGGSGFYGGAGGGGGGGYYGGGGGGGGGYAAIGGCCPHASGAGGGGGGGSSYAQGGMISHVAGYNGANGTVIIKWATYVPNATITGNGIIELTANIAKWNTLTIRGPTTTVRCKGGCFID